MSRSYLLSFELREDVRGCRTHSILLKDGRCRETVFRAIEEEVFLPWDLRFGPTVRSDANDPSWSNGLDNLVGLEIDLNATAAQWNFAFLLGDLNDRSVGCHMTWAVVAGSLFQGIFRAVDLSSDIFFEIVVECLIHATEKSEIRIGLQRTNRQQAQKQCTEGVRSYNGKSFGSFVCHLVSAFHNRLYLVTRSDIPSSHPRTATCLRSPFLEIR